MTAKKIEEVVETPQGQFSTAVTNALEKKGWSVLKLAEELDATYEHIRKIVRGTGFPSKRMLRDLTTMLDLDPAQMQRLVVADKIQHKYGNIPLELSGKNPRFVQIERLLPSLTDDQFQTMLGMLQGMDRNNRRQSRD